MNTFQTPACQRQFRLVDHQGAPHPVLDDLYESLDAAWGEAMEVSTASGNWRTVRYPGS